MATKTDRLGETRMMNCDMEITRILMCVLKMEP
mgnify:CR=1 FL=1